MYVTRLNLFNTGEWYWLLSLRLSHENSCSSFDLLELAADGDDETVSPLHAPLSRFPPQASPRTTP